MLMGLLDLVIDVLGGLIELLFGSSDTGSGA